MLDTEEMAPPTLSPEVFAQLDKTLAGKGPHAAVEELCASLRELGDYNALFYAMLMKKRIDLNVTPFPTDLRNFPYRRLNGMDFVPLADGVRATDVALREYYGLAVYKLLLTFRPGMFSSSVPAAGSALR